MVGSWLVLITKSGADCTCLAAAQLRQVTKTQLRSQTAQAKMIIPTPNLKISIFMTIINLNIIPYLPMTVIIGSGRFVVSVVLRDSPLSCRVLFIALTVVSSTKLCSKYIKIRA
jgi:hypothetical protein